MYVPAHFAEDDRTKILTLIESEPFGILVSNVDGRPFATHVPFVIMDDGASGPVLGTHVARANPQWKSIETQPVMAIFAGAHAHVSAAWYADPAATVPTWDYAAVHCTGKARLLDAAGARRILDVLVARNEGPDGWTMQTAPEEYVERMIGAIAAMELRVEHIDAQFKYSQNRSDEDRERVLRQLRESPDPVARRLADEMTAYYEGLATSPSALPRRRSLSE